MHFFQGAPSSFTVFALMKIIFIQKVLYRDIYGQFQSVFLQIFIQKVLHGKCSFTVFLCIQNLHPKCSIQGHLNCYRWACPLSAAAAAGGGGGAAAAAVASWALAGCSPGFQICCCKSSPRVVRNTGLALHSWPSKAPRGMGGGWTVKLLLEDCCTRSLRRRRRRRRSARKKKKTR